MSSVTVCTALLVDHEAPVTADELARFCNQHIDWVVTLVEQGIVTATVGQQREHWRFASQAVTRARSVARLQRDFEVNPDAAALMIDLMEEIRQLKALLSNHR
ncbi:MerR family transcriptional regulator [Orrella sp. NBD-18]|uniref:MerR family transcriptional regulator n=1 Tax=Sheuella amnicola TaxID=2707330 RepID=A0A6B2R1U7_9BURK|nr:chaperone modulator CbpM [Sheuella amnicola]NDY82977.1 MerR family transcriptional regulator [Sheuella amnicola]HBI82730.1 MerR family transcriptional regulator [Alcaligenaceae bacterium]